MPKCRYRFKDKRIIKALTATRRPFLFGFKYSKDDISKKYEEVLGKDIMKLSIKLGFKLLEFRDFWEKKHPIFSFTYVKVAPIIIYPKRLYSKYLRVSIKNRNGHGYTFRKVKPFKKRVRLPRKIKTNEEIFYRLFPRLKKENIKILPKPKRKGILFMMR